MDTPTIVVTGNKGGTGKTMVAANLASRLAVDSKVGVLDADLDSPNLPEVMGIQGVMDLDTLQNFVLVEPVPNMKVFSMRLFATQAAEHGFSKPGDQADQIINDAIKYSNWGFLDWLVVDLPAGSSDEFRAVVKRLKNVVGLIIVTLPNTITDLKRVADLSGRFRLPIMGVVENLTRAVCPNCETNIPLFGGAGNTRVEKLCGDLHIKYLGGIPYVPEVHNTVDRSFRLPDYAGDVIDRIMEELDAERTIGETEDVPSDHQSDEAVV